MRKLILVAISFLLVTSAYALNETDNGPIHDTVCYIVGAGPVTSGDVVVLQTSSPTYWGREVTGSTSEGLAIYGVVSDSRNWTSEDIADGEWVRVRRSGYCPIVKISYGTAVTVNTASAYLVTSEQRFAATSCTEISRSIASGETTGNTVALESVTSKIIPVAGARPEAGKTVKALLSW